MTAALFSLNWHRVAQLRPRLRAQVRVRKQRARDQTWYLAIDEAAGRQLRINEAAYAVIGRCDGRHSVQQIWESVLAGGAEAAPTQDETIAVLTRLDEAGMLAVDQPIVDPEAMFERSRQARARRRKARLNPLAFRVPLGNPAAMLRRLDPLARLLLRPSVFALWLAAMLLAALAVAAAGSELAAHLAALAGSPRLAALAVPVFVAMKLVHELAHGMAVRRYGGEVSEAGVSLLLLVPAPYVDASASAAFASRRERALVAAIGVMVELALAAAGFAVWTQVQSGLVRDAALVVMLVGGISTLLVNGNPLLRFDGYHVLCDALDLPNLAPRSAEFWRTLIQRHLLRADAAPFVPAAGELKWLLVYGPAALVYRFALLAAVLIWVGAHSTLLAAVLAAYLGVALLLLPGIKFLREAFAQSALGGAARRARFAACTLAAVLLAAFFAAPLPSYTVARGVVWPPDQAQVRPAVDGFVKQIAAADGAPVAAGDVLLVLDNPELPAARLQLLARLEGLQHDRFGALLTEPLRAQNLAEEAAAIDAELARIEERIAGLTVRAQVGGRLVMPRQADLAGRFAGRGTPIGFILGDADSTVRVAVAQADAALLRSRLQAVSILADGSPNGIVVRVSRDAAATTNELPSAALGERGGGSLAVDPADAEGRRSLEPVFLFELTAPEPRLQRIGQRVWVRFDTGAEPLAAQLYRRAGQLLLRQFNPSV